jgi:hypothetical protein
MQPLLPNQTTAKMKQPKKSHPLLQLSLKRRKKSNTNKSATSLSEKLRAKVRLVRSNKELTNQLVKK